MNSDNNKTEKATNVTIREIARQAGVCIGTVSRVINNKTWVDSTTRERVMAVIQKTGYEPSARGRALALKRSHGILLLVQNISDPYYAMLSDQVQAECRSKGYNLWLGASNFNTELEADYLLNCAGGRADGAIICPIQSSKNVQNFKRLIQRRFPVVLMDTELADLQLPCVKNDDLAAGKIGTEFLIGKGHKRIAFVGWRTEFHTIRDRIKGYRETLNAHGLESHPEYVLTLPDAVSEWRADFFKPALQSRHAPTAFLAENEVVGTMCLSALIKLGQRVPEQVALVAIGGTIQNEMLPIPFTSVLLNTKELGRQAVELLCKLIEDPKLGTLSHEPHQVTPSLIMRQTA